MNLASAIMGDADAPTLPLMKQGTVMSVNPLTVTVGASTVAAPCTSLDSYSPAVGDVVTVLVNGADRLVLGAAVASSEGWTSYTPTLTNVTLGNGTLEGWYVRIGRTIHFRVKLTWGSTTSASGLQGFSLPVAMHSSYLNMAYGTAGANIGGTNYVGFPWCNSTTGFIVLQGTSGSSFWSNTAPATWGTSNIGTIVGTYEAAA